MLYDITIAIYIELTYFASSTGFEDAILKVNSNLHVQRSKFGGQIYKSGGKSSKKVELCGVCGVSFFQVWTVHFWSNTKVIKL